METTERRPATTAALAGAVIVFLYCFATSWHEDVFNLIFSLPYLMCAIVASWLLAKPILKPWLKKNGVRISLITAITLMFAAACIVWLNVDQPYGEVWYSTGGGKVGIQADHQGWPLPYRIQTTAYPNLTIPSIILTSLLIDVFVAVIILVSIAVVCEWVVRSRTAVAKKPEKP